MNAISPMFQDRKVAHNAARGIFFERDGCLQAAHAPRFDGQDYAPGPTPKVGEHTAEVLACLRDGHAQAAWRQTR